MADAVADWLLEGPPWVQYRTHRDLWGRSESEPEVVAARQATIAHLQTQRLLAELAEWPGRPLTNHKDAGHPLHKLVFIADLGLRAGDPGIDNIIERILEQRSPQGPFRIAFGKLRGGSEGQQGWMLCDAPLVVYALTRLGLGEEPRLRTATAHLASLARDNGWPCVVSPELGRFRGPGRKDDPCPYATLVMLKALAETMEWRDSPASHRGAEALLELWTQSRNRHPYLFYMGTDFRKLKAPLVWYDILHVLDALTRFPWLRGDARLGEMAAIVRAKADERGRFSAESVWKAWADWDCGQKRAPSPWLTLLVRRALRRLDA